jgi:dihydroorotase
VTSFLEMPNTVPTTTTVERLHQKLELASTQSLVNYGFYMGATPDNLAELQRAQRTPGIKIFIGSSTGDLLVDEQAALERIFGETHLPICAHCEDEATVRRNQERWAGITDVAIHSKIRDHQSAVTCTLRALDLAQRHGHQFHVLHVSTADELPILQAAPDYITAEVCPHHLFFSIDDYARLGSLIKMNPSIKTRRDCAALWQGLLDGTIDLIATDHAPHTWEEKQQPYPACPSGLPAVENSLALIANQVALGLCTWPQLVKWMCQRPAEVWHIPQKGRIQVGYHADVVLVDPQLQQTIRHEQQLTKSRWSPWHGTTLTGWPVRTWVGGHQVYEWTPNGPNLDESRCGGEIHFDPARKTRFS